MGSMCILLNVKLIGCNGVAWIYGQLGGLLGMGYVHSSKCETYWACNGVEWIYGQLGGLFCHGYMCILLNVKLIGCNGVCMDLCLNVGSLSMGCHSSKYETYWCNGVYDLWSIGGSISLVMCILLNMKLIGCNGVCMDLWSM